MSQLQHLPIEAVRFVSNVRVSVEDDLDELAASVSMFGVMQPITVRQEAKGKYVVLYGHRRLAAARRAGLKTIPAIVTVQAADELVARQIVENLQRKDLSLSEQAKAVRLLYEEHGVASLVAEMIGKRPSWVSKTLTLTAPGKSKQARKLIEADLIADLDVAYTLCQIEAKRPEEAERLAELATKGTTLTRQMVRDMLDGITEDDHGDDDDDEEAAAPAAKEKTYALSQAQRTYILRAVDNMNPGPDLGVHLSVKALLS